MPLSRRTLLLSGVVVGGGLGLAWFVRRLDDGDATARFAATTPDHVGLNAWLKIAPDGRVICAIHRAEMGQGVTTSLPMLLAEELDADWGRIRVEFAAVDRDYFNFGMLDRGRPFGEIDGRPLAAAGTWAARRAFHWIGLSMTISSTSMIDGWDSLRSAGASARAMLMAAAARRWSVPVERLDTDRGRVIDRVTGRFADYGRLASDAAAERPPRRPALRDPARHRLIGTSPPRLDIPGHVSGTTRYSVDQRLPDMLFGTVRHAGRLGARIESVDSSMLGDDIQVVPAGERAVAVLARDTWTAMQAARKIRIRETGGTVPDSERIFERLGASLDDPDAPVFEERGETETTWGQAGRRAEAVYRLPYLAHLCMEPMSCAALYEDGQLTLWAPTQAHSLARDVAAERLGLDPAAVTVHTVPMGGAFGRRAEMDFIEQAADAAYAVPGRPVNLCWSREEDIRNDMYRQAAVGRVRGMLDDAGRIAALDYVLASQSVVASYHGRTPNPRGGNALRDRSALSGALDLHYSIPATRCRYVPHEFGIPVGFWRAVGNSVNPFLVESFIDELASLAGADPVAFRIAHLTDHPKHRRVLEAAAERSGWGNALPAGRGRGVALIQSHDSIVAQVVEVSIAGDRTVRVHRVTCVVDCRLAVHPDSVIAQMEGGILQGLNAALHGEITVREGSIEQQNFDDCPLLRLADAPDIDVVLMPQGGRPGGAGEPGLPAVAPALANAIFAASGVRVRSLPIGKLPAAA